MSLYTNIPNERSVELPWLLTQPIIYPALDVGSHESIYLNDLTGPVDGIDVRPQGPSPLRNFYQADIRTWVAPEKYPTVLAISTVEHIGLEFQPYTTLRDDSLQGDRAAVVGCMNALTPDGVLYLTVPFGEPGEFGWWRRYGKPGLHHLLRDYTYQIETVMNDTWPVGGVALITVRA